MFTFLLLKQREHFLARLTCDGLMAAEARGDWTDLVEQRIGPPDIQEAEPVIVEIIINHPCPRVDVLGYVRQQAAATKKVNEYCVLGVLACHLGKVAGEHALLPHEREWRR